MILVLQKFIYARCCTHLKWSVTTYCFLGAMGSTWLVSAEPELKSGVSASSTSELPEVMRLPGRLDGPMDRTFFWIPSFDRVKSRLDKDFAALSNAERESITNEQVVAKQEIDELIASATRPWSSRESIEIYRRIVRLAFLGSRDSSYVKSIVSSIPYSFVDKSFLTVQSRATNPHPIMRWPAQAYARVESPHFEVSTQGSVALASNIAILAEQTYAVWQQAFVPAWCEPHSLESAVLDGQALQSASNRLEGNRLKIALFKNRDQYLRGLRDIQPNIGISTGFYHPDSRTVFCYWDETVSAQVLRHEITHQLFSEAGVWDPLVVEQMLGNFWVIEGIALYMESMQIDPAIRCDRVTLGGWDAPRLQPARYRRLHDEYWIPLEEFKKASSQTFQQGDAIRQHYSQAAGLTHFWMDHSIDSRVSLVDFICGVYRQEPVSKNLLYTDDTDQLRAQYDTFLLSAAKHSRRLPPRPATRDIVLSRCEIDSDLVLSWPAKQGQKFDWLDLAFTKVDDRMWTEASSGRWDTRRLNLEGTGVSNDSIAAIASINRLEELDLSTCKVSGDGLEPLRGHRSLRKLWLTGTDVTDELVDLLVSITRLEEVDLTGTQFTDGGRKELARRIPKLRRK